MIISLNNLLLIKKKFLIFKSFKSHLSIWNWQRIYH